MLVIGMYKGSCKRKGLARRGNATTIYNRWAAPAAGRRAGLAAPAWPPCSAQHGLASVRLGRRGPLYEQRPEPGTACRRGRSSAYVSGPRLIGRPRAAVPRSPQGRVPRDGGSHVGGRPGGGGQGGGARGGGAGGGRAGERQRERQRRGARGAGCVARRVAVFGARRVMLGGGRWGFAAAGCGPAVLRLSGSRLRHGQCLHPRRCSPSHPETSSLRPLC